MEQREKAALDHYLTTPPEVDDDKHEYQPIEICAECAGEEDDPVHDVE